MLYAVNELASAVLTVSASLKSPPSVWLIVNLFAVVDTAVTEATMLVNPAALIAAAISSASLAVPTAVNDTVLAVSKASVVFSDSLIVNDFAPALIVPVFMMLLVTDVAAPRATFLRHSLKVTVSGVVSNPEVSLALACVNSESSAMPAPPPLRSR